MDFLLPLTALIPGAKGRLLAALSQAGTSLSQRRLAEVAGVSPAQASRVLPGLVELGLVERRDVPPSALFRLVPEHLANRALRSVLDFRGTFIEFLRQSAGELHPEPVALSLFGSVARGDARAGSDVDLLIVRPRAVSDDDEAWTESLERWLQEVRLACGNQVNPLEVAEDELPALLRGRRAPWKQIRQQGIRIVGTPLEKLAAAGE